MQHGATNYSLGSYAFRDPNVCVGAFPVLVLGLFLLPLVVVIFLALIFGGLLPGADSAQLFNWNFFELLAAFAWLASLASPANALVVALLRAVACGRGDAPLQRSARERLALLLCQEGLAAEAGLDAPRARAGDSHRHI